MAEQINLPYSKEALLLAIENHFFPKYLLFWGHQSNHSEISKSCLSQWFTANFSVEGVLYKSAEHYMMAEKAKLFKDEKAFQKILMVEHPGEAKKYGREIQNFDETLWQTQRFEIVVRGNFAKFQQNQPLKDFLLNTGNRILVEASPVDKIWGIGFAENQPEAIQPEKWLGLNLLGFALMKTRDLLLNNRTTQQ